MSTISYMRSNATIPMIATISIPNLDDYSLFMPFKAHSHGLAPLPIEQSATSHRTMERARCIVRFERERQLNTIDNPVSNVVILIDRSPGSTRASDWSKSRFV